MKFEFVGVTWCQIWKLHKAPGEIEPKAALPDVSATELAARAIEKWYTKIHKASGSVCFFERQLVTICENCIVKMISKKRRRFSFVFHFLKIFNFILGTYESKQLRMFN